MANEIAKPVNITPTKVAGTNILGSGLGAAAIKAIADAKAAGIAPVPVAPAVKTTAEPVIEQSKIVAEPEKVALTKEEEPKTETKTTTDDKISDTDYAKRLAKINNAQKALDKQKQEFSKEREELNYYRNHMKNLKDNAIKDPLKTIQEHFGIPPEKFIDAWLDSQGATRKQREQVKEQGITKDQLTTILKEEIDKSLTGYKEKSTNEAVLLWKEQTLRPLVSDATKFPLLNAEYGKDAADVLHTAMVNRAQKANALPDSDPNKQEYIRQSHDPFFMSDLAEKTLKEQAERYVKLLGVETAPKTEATTNANPATSVANSPKKEIQFNHIWRPTGKMTYTTKPKE